MGLRERFRLEEVEGDSLLYVAPLALYERSDSEQVNEKSKKSDKDVVKDFDSDSEEDIVEV